MSASTQDSAKAPIDIAVGVLVASDGRVLVACRRANTPGAGFWEFPGGKREAGEDMEACLKREPAEEIGISDIEGQPLICFAHDRGPRPVRLHVWRIHAWHGEPHGREGQQVRWAAPESLDLASLLPATEIILNALALPSAYLMTPAVADYGESDWLAGIDATLEAGITLLRVRDHALDDAAYARLAAEVVIRAHEYGAQVLVDRDIALMQAVGAQGVHWSMTRLEHEGSRPKALVGWLAVSAHDSGDLERAITGGADFATLSPVRSTATHPEAVPMGWSGFALARADHAVPVYALGGLGSADMSAAHQHNAQGVAALRGWWPKPE